MAEIRKKKMLKKYSFPDELSGQSQVKTSVARGIRNKIIETFPTFAGNLEELIPKKSPLIVAKSKEHLNLIMIDNQVLFFNIRDGPYFPTLRILHQYPDIVTKVQVDRGAIKHVLSGANIMCPGLTSKGGNLPPNIEKGSVVAIMAEGKKHAVALGIMTMSSEEILEKNKGIGIENIHCLHDGLWEWKTEST